MNKPPGYLELDRRFRRLDESAKAEDLAIGSYLAIPFGAPGDLRWDHLLKEKLVVVLGEPGSGKSWELRSRCADIRERGEIAFFVELERLVAGAANTVLSPEDHGLLESWKRSDLPAHFFLDSVDEAKIRRQCDFHAALDRLRNAIGPAAIERARFVISSRISEWRPETDRQELLSRFGIGRVHKQRNQQGTITETDPDAVELLVVQIEPLDRDQVRTFIANRGIVDADHFVTAIDEQSAWDFAGRPLDVLELAAFWKAKGRLGSLTEIIENNVSLKLKERIDRLNNTVLSEAQARIGAETLAAATILCKQQQFKVPDDAFAATNALIPANCLPADWQAEEVNALLNRAMFDSASYGQIRFHHRRVAEYLAAQWLRARILEGCPLRAVKELLFADLPLRRVLRPSLAPVAAWLCGGTEAWTQDVRSWVLEAAPEIHLEFGDATALPLDYRRSLLMAWVDRNAGRQRVWVRSSPDALRRLSHPSLAGEIANLLADASISIDVREELVQLVRYGSLRECLPALVTIVAGATEHDNLKRVAVAAISDMGTPESRQTIWELVSQRPTISNGLCAQVCQALYPVMIGPQDLVLLIRKTPADSDRHFDLSWGIERHLESTLPMEQCGELLAELNQLVQSSPRIYFSNKETRISKQFEWVLDVIVLVVAKLLSKTSLTEAECDVAANSLMLIGESHYFHHHNEQVATLDVATHAHPHVRRAYFWQRVAGWRSEYGSAVPYLHFVFGFTSILHPARTDLAWLTQEIESRTEHADKKLVLQITLQLPNWASRSFSEKHRLRQAIGTNKELVAHYRGFLSEQRWAWLRHARYRLTNAGLWRDWWSRLCRKIVLKRDYIFEQWRLYRRLTALRSGQAVNLLAHLCREAEDSGHRWAPTDWSCLIAKRGTRITQAVKAGCKNSWRAHSPPLPHEKQQPNETGFPVIVGLSGLQTMASDGEFSVRTISDEDAQLATRYAVNEMNGFPPWLQTLAAIRPEHVAQVLNECVLGEWEYAADRPHVHDVLADLSWHGGTLAGLVQRTVVERLRRGDPAHPEILGFVLTLCLKSASLQEVALMQTAVSRCRLAPLDTHAFALWCAVCLQLDAGEGMTVLEQRLRGSTIADDVMIRICGVLGSRDRLPMIPRPSFLSPPALQRLIPLVYRHVRLADDIDRSGKGAYSPTLRDEAQEFRGGLLSRLAQSDDTGATEALRTLLTDDSLAPDHDWIRHLVHERVEKDADLLAWQASDVRAFAREYETDPKTDRELFRIVVNRLTDIKNDVEKSDNSLREEVQQGSEEYVLRRFLARKLNERSRQRYTVPQEGEIDQEQRPDLRAENPRSAPVSIEIKWANNWTIDELVAGLVLQLVSQYMRSHCSRHGIYVLGMDGRGKRNWNAGNGKRLSFSEVTDLLVARARELTAQRQDLDEVHVIGIDFRNPPEA